MAQEWMAELVKSGWLDIAKVVLPSSAISSLMTIGWNSWRDARLRRTDRKDTALSVALSLESYARTCRKMMHRAEWASNSAMQTQSYDSIRSVELPVFSFPEKLEWKWLSTKVTSGLREFPAVIHSTRNFLDSVWEYGDPLEFCEEVAFESAKAAKRALELARMTRRKYGVVAWQPGGIDSNLHNELSEHISRTEESRRKLRERRDQFMSDLKAEKALVENK
ncbi:hypothetical protein [Caballeronia sp. Lep1P3]|uniref:hypothetical protein n=1 Tax=Caballeronia sp. Lep1P3 TaxID=2878150 RepID=UPI001FD3D487|nr:hypothetical protein [Caballeronia sp. Lep1P3]